jgi:hypothetical protein
VASLVGFGAVICGAARVYDGSRMGAVSRRWPLVRRLATNVLAALTGSAWAADDCA